MPSAWGSTSGGGATWSAPWAPGPTGVVLDLAAGTLDVTLALIRRYPGLRVIAADICAPMLDYGMERKVKPDEKERITPLWARQGRSLPLPDASVDAVTIAFGIRNVRPRPRLWPKCTGVLTPGGRACVLEFGSGGHAGLRRRLSLVP